MVKKVVIQAVKLHSNNKPKTPLQVAHQIQQPHYLKKMKQAVVAWQAS